MTQSRRLRLLLAACLLALLPAARGVQADSVTVFAAASLKTALDEIVAGFEAATGHDVSVALAGSSALARQIQAGAPADLFISANRAWMDVLDRDGLLAPGTRVDLVSNRLVLIAPAPADQIEIDASLDLLSRLGDGRLAMALVQAVPAGIYGKAALEHLGLWQAVAPRVAQTDNVRAALALVALGEAPLGLVYASDAQAEPRVGVVGTVPRDTHPPILYPAAVLRDKPAARTLLAHLQSPAAQAVFAAQGFTLLED